MEMLRHIRALIVWGLFLGVMIGGCTPAVSDIPPGTAREFILIASNMRFIGEKPDSIKGIESPDLIVYLGDKVKITVRNKENTLIFHDFRISNYPDTRLKQSIRPNAEGVVEFVAGRSGDYTYYCPNHQTTMYGRFIVMRR